MRHEANLRVAPLSATGTKHTVTIQLVGGSILVSQDPLKIRPGDSVQWDFPNIPDGWTRDIRFRWPLGVNERRGPFTMDLSPGSYLSGSTKVNTILGKVADDRKGQYKYDVVLITPNGTHIELDPIIENEGPPSP